MKNVLKYSAAVLAAFGISILVSFYMNDDKPIKFVSPSRVMEASNLKKEYEAELIAFEKESNEKLRVMDENIKLKEIEGVDASRIQYLRSELDKSRELLSKEYGKRSEEYQTTVWKQINSIIEKYGKDHGYKFILGATGDGAIMFAAEGEDITKEIIKYINK